MKRRIEGLHQADQADHIADSLVLVRVDAASYQRERKPFYSLRFSILRPKELSAHSFVSRLYCTPKELWKLNWFLHDFGYDPELLGRDEIDDRSLVGLQGVVKVTHRVVSGRIELNLDSFAPANGWLEPSDAAMGDDASGQEAAR